MLCGLVKFLGLPELVCLFNQTHELRPPEARFASPALSV